MVRNRRFVAALAAFSALGALVLFAACADQSEGERCQLDNGDQDCAKGLICTRSTDLPIAPNFRGQARDNEGRCCPKDRSQATVAECAQTPPAPGGDAALPVVVDGGSDGPGTDSASGDTGTGADTSTDGASDARVDAPTDANDAG